MLNIEPIDIFKGLRVNFELLPFCNFKCSYCYEHKKVKFNHIITLNEVKLINKSLLQSSYPVDLYLLGGEPLYYSKLVEVIKIFKSNPRVQKINIFTNGSRDLSNLLGLELHFILSYHPSQDNNYFLKNVKLLKDESFEINLLMQYKYRDRLLQIDKLLSNITVKPTYLYIPTSEYKKNTKMFQVQEPFLQCESTKEFIFNSTQITKNYLLKGKFNQFKGWKCSQSRICINNIGNICIGCGPAVSNIFREPGFFKTYKIKTTICENDYCVKDMFLTQRKTNDIL